MRSQVSVTFKNNPPVRVDLHEEPPMPRDEARRWLDEQFIAMECEPLRATGKLLMADRVVVVAQAAGPTKFADEAWAKAFAHAACSVLGKLSVNIDADALSITY